MQELHKQVSLGLVQLVHNVTTVHVPQQHDCSDVQANNPAARY